jgi:hypothetical protein
VLGAGMAADAPLGAVLTGLQLLLARSQLWQETAAKHVSLAAQLERLNAIALRWSRVQLASWRSTIRRVSDCQAAGVSPHMFAAPTARKSPEPSLQDLALLHHPASSICVPLER